MEESDQLALAEDDGNVPAGSTAFVRASLTKDVHELRQFHDGVFTYRPTTGRARAITAEQPEGVRVVNAEVGFSGSMWWKPTVDCCITHHQHD